MISLPLITVQHDAERVIGDVREGLMPNDKFWISFYKTGEPSIHASITVTKLLRSEAANPIPSSDNVPASGNSQPQVHLEPDNGGLELIRNSNSYSVSCRPLHIRDTPCRFPRASIRIAKRDGDGDRNMNAESIPSFDVSPDEQRLAIGHEDGSISVRRLGVTDENSNGVTQKRKIHLDAITSLRFFPSSQVLLSSSADFSVSVISADDLNLVPRVFKGHRRTVTDTAIIDRGKQVLSCGKDGSVRIWDCGSGKQVGLMSVKGYSPVMKIALGEGENHVNFDDQGTPSESNGGKMLFCALQNGHVEAFDISSKSSVLSLPPPLSNTSLYSIACSTRSHLLATGSTRGLISVYDTRFISPRANGTKPPEPLFTCHRNEACIEDLAFIEPAAGSDSHSKLAVATYDGTPFVLSIRPDGPAVYEELVGYDCDPCRTVRVRGDGKDIWVAGDDGFVRKY